MEWFQKEYPDAEIKEVNAAIGGTGSALGVFRLGNDVLCHRPDLVFVEFAVNDARVGTSKILKAMEGIVRQIWNTSAETDICFVYTITYDDSERLGRGKMKRSASIMEEVADHYGIPSIHFGVEVARMEREGELVFKTNEPVTHVSGDELNEAAKLVTDEQGRIIFSKDGVHPYPQTGHVLYTRALIRSMEEMRDEKFEFKHVVPDPIHSDNWEMATQCEIQPDMLQGPWRQLNPAESSIAAKVANRVDPLYRLEPGASLNFKFKGSQTSIYDIYGPDCGLVEVMVDGKELRKVERIDRYSSYHRLTDLYVAGGLDPNVVHSVTIRVLEEPLDKRSILLERNQSDFDDNPEKYEGFSWYAGSIFLLGHIVE